MLIFVGKKAEFRQILSKTKSDKSDQTECVHKTTLVEDNSRDAIRTVSLPRIYNIKGIEDLVRE